MTFIPDASTLLAYTVACVILFITPGPDMSLMLAKTLQGGRKAGMASMLGASAGCLAHSAAAALGLSAIIAASATLFTIMKVVGALYLLYLAYDAIRHGSALRVEGEAGVEVRARAGQHLLVHAQELGRRVERHHGAHLAVDAGDPDRIEHA